MKNNAQLTKSFPKSRLGDIPNFIKMQNKCINICMLKII